MIGHGGMSIVYRAAPSGPRALRRPEAPAPDLARTPRSRSGSPRVTAGGRARPPERDTDLRGGRGERRLLHRHEVCPGLEPQGFAATQRTTRSSADDFRHRSGRERAQRRARDGARASRCEACERAHRRGCGCGRLRPCLPLGFRDRETTGLERDQGPECSSVRPSTRRPSRSRARSSTADPTCIARLRPVPVPDRKSPFEKESEVALIYAHLLEPPPSIQAARPELGPAIDVVLTRRWQRGRKTGTRRERAVNRGPGGAVPACRRAEPSAHRRGCAADDDGDASGNRRAARGRAAAVAPAAQVEAAAPEPRPR